jgi:hypothetical protein
VKWGLNKFILSQLRDPEKSFLRSRSFAQMNHSRMARDLSAMRSAENAEWGDRSLSESKFCKR